MNNPSIGSPTSHNLSSGGRLPAEQAVPSALQKKITTAATQRLTEQSTSADSLTKPFLEELTRSFQSSSYQEKAPSKALALAAKTLQENPVSPMSNSKAAAQSGTKPLAIPQHEAQLSHSQLPTRRMSAETVVINPNLSVAFSKQGGSTLNTFGATTEHGSFNVDEHPDFASRQQEESVYATPRQIGDLTAQSESSVPSNASKATPKAGLQHIKQQLEKLKEKVGSLRDSITQTMSQAKQKLGKQAEALKTALGLTNKLKATLDDNYETLDKLKSDEKLSPDEEKNSRSKLEQLQNRLSEIVTAIKAPVHKMKQEIGSECGGAMEALRSIANSAMSLLDTAKSSLASSKKNNLEFHQASHAAQIILDQTIMSPTQKIDLLREACEKYIDDDSSLLDLAMTVHLCTEFTTGKETRDGELNEMNRWLAQATVYLTPGPHPKRDAA